MKDGEIIKIIKKCKSCFFGKESGTTTNKYRKQLTDCKKG